MFLLGEIDFGKSFRTSPDSESGQAISNLRDPRAESCRYFAVGKTVDRSILRYNWDESPGSASTGRTPLRKISKNSFPRDTKQLFGRHVSLEITSPQEKGAEGSLCRLSVVLRMRVWRGGSRRVSYVRRRP